MDSNKLTASWNEGELIISGLVDPMVSNAPKPWKASRVSSKLMVAYEESSDRSPDKAHGFAQCSPDMVYDLFTGVNHRRWSGMIFVDTGFGHKKIYFNQGELVFASSDLMDDRLGEVIYRDAVISLDQLTEFAVQVDRKTKFGQVLLRSGTFTNTDLWHSLKSQVREIFRSVFLSDACYVEVQPVMAPMEVSFEDGTDVLLEAAYSYGAQFRSFSRRINSDVRIHLVDLSAASNAVPGTFIGDFIELCKDNPTVEEILERSQLARINTTVALHRLVATGILSLDGLSEASAMKVDARFASLKSVIDAYQMLHGIASSAFKVAGISMPIRDLSEFCLSLNHDGGVSLYLDKIGNLPVESISDMFQQCVTNATRLSYFQIRIESLMRYLLQMSGDILPFESARNLKKEFKEITS